MQNNFWFDHEKYDFWPIYETIKTYCPIGLIGDEFSDSAPQYVYPGNQQKHKLIYENLQIKKNYRAKWGLLEKFLKKQFKKPIINTTSLFYPCFQGHILIAQNRVKNFKWTKELHFSISFLGPYYTIYGLDSSTIVLESDMSLYQEETEDRGESYSRNQVITVSPVFEYKDAFLLLEQSIKEQLPGYKFIPFEINMMNLVGLNGDPGNLDQKTVDCIHCALFHPSIELDLPVRGDSRYGYEEWKIKREATEEDIKNQKLLERHKAENLQSVPTAASPYKVWKYRDFNRLPDLFQGGHFMFGMNIPFNILDLTDKKKLLYVNEEIQFPVSSPYTITENELYIENTRKEIRYRISHLTANELRLVVNINIEEGGKKLQGDAAELVFEPYKP